MDTFTITPELFATIQSELVQVAGKALVSVDNVPNEYTGGTYLGVTTKGIENGAIGPVVARIVAADLGIDFRNVLRSLIVNEDENRGQVSWCTLITA